MKNKIRTLVAILTTIAFLPCKAQSLPADQAGSHTAPKIENYTKGELTIKVAPFGLDGNEITVGKIMADGTIHFNWPEINAQDYETSGFFMHSLDFLLGMYNCNEEIIEDKNEVIKAADTKFLMLYSNKYEQQVGSLHPATHKNIENSHSFLTIGSYFSWFYSNGDGKLNAVCTRYNRIKDSDDYDENSIYGTKIYTINFKKGWNLVEHKVLEVKDQKWNNQLRSMRYKEEKLSVNKMPTNINWNLKYWADDESLEIEYQLLKKTPITKEQYKNWLPNKLGNLKRTNYEIGKKLERISSTDNINLVFEKGQKKIDVTILDCAGSKESAQDYTMILDMTSQEWKNDTDTGYQSALKMDGIPVLIQYNEKEKTTTLYFNSNGRFSINAKGNGMNPDELWDHLKSLDLEKLVE